MSTMIQNPNEIEAFTRRQRALARIHRNIAEKFQLNRRQFISGSLATMALAALGLSGCAPKTPAVPMLCRRIFFAFFLIFILSTPE